ncbi:MAG: TrmH family RNA methyltransferase [Acidimicrobiales bacterium]
MKQLDGTGLKRLHREWRRRTTGRVALLLDGVQQPYNVGAILRLAAAYRVEHLWLAGATAPPTAAGARKTALGADRYLTWTSTTDAVDAVHEAKADGWRVVGIELAQSARPIHEVSLLPAVCLALGHEDRGLSRAALAACDDVAFIPQLGRIGSLNVASAAAIALYEARRQDWTTPVP